MYYFERGRLMSDDNNGPRFNFETFEDLLNAISGSSKVQVQLLKKLVDEMSWITVWIKFAVMLACGCAGLLLLVIIVAWLFS